MTCPSALHRARLSRVLQTVVLTVVAVTVTACTAMAAPPPAPPHVVTAQTETDSVVLTDYATTAPVTVQLLRGGVLIATSQPITPANDAGGTLVEINVAAPALTGACWLDTTPNIAPGDVVRIIQNGVTEDATVQNVTSSGPTAGSDPATVVVTGSGRTPGGQPLAPTGLQEQLSNTAFALGRPFRRTPDDGAMAATPPGSGNWTATFAGLTPDDYNAALSAVAGASWTSVLGTEATEYEFGAFGGTQGICTSPPLTEGITNVTPRAILFNTNSLAISGVAENDVTTVSVLISDTNPLTPDVNAGPVATQSFVGGKVWTIPIVISQILPLTDGSLTITPIFAPGLNPQRTGAMATITKDMVVPDLMPPVASIVSGPRPFARSTVATFDLASNEPGTFQCRLDTAAFATCSDPTRLIGLTQGSHTFSARAIDGAGNVSAEVTHTWQVDIKRPGLTGRVTAGQRGTLARRGIVLAATTCDERCTVTFDAKIVMPGAIPGRARVLSRPVTLNAAAKGLPRARVGRIQREAIQRSLRAGRTVLVFFNITAVDRVGNRTIIHTNARLTKADLG